MKPPDAGVEAWILKAQSDLLCIENNLAAERVPWDAVVFHAQQAGEKLLKALLVSAGQPVPRTHDVIALFSLVLGAGIRLESAREDAELLSRFGVAVRYPDSIYEPNDDDGREMTGAALRLRDAVRNLLARGSGAVR